MNCVRCDYLLWDLPEPRCPECGLGFHVTDYAFVRGAVHFICPYCGQSYLGTDERGLPQPQRFACVGCQHPLDADHMPVKPILESARGEPLRAGTPWQYRRREGFLPGYMDAVARLAISPDEYFRFASANRHDGAQLFGIVCAYVAAIVCFGALMFFRSTGLASWIPDLSVLLRFPWVLYALCAVPLLHIAWTYVYGLLIQIVLWGLGLSRSELDSSVRAVSLGSAVLPAVMLFPPVGLVWYLIVICSGLEHFHDTTRSKALAAALIPMLLAANALFFVFITVWMG